MSAPLGRWLLASLIAFTAACDPGKEEWTPPPAAAPATEVQPRERCSDRDPLRRPFYGDLHVHTHYSMDAWVGGMRLTPDDAYRFASGREITLVPFDDEGNTGTPARIDRPLDFAAVTDHAEWLGEVKLCTTPGSPVFETRGCRIYRGEAQSLIARLLGLEGFYANIVGLIGLTDRNRQVCGEDAKRCRGALATAWSEIQDAAERWYDRSSACSFTTFHAWEYSRSPDLSKVHRNVVLRNELSPELPFSWLDSPTEHELWRKLREFCNETDSDCEAITIPHNPNLSNGQLFSIWYRDLPLEEQRRQARMRAEIEPLVEMMQIKGESECRNGLYGVVGGPDELCDFEKMRDMPGIEHDDCGEETGSGAQAGRGCVSRLDYARYVLIEGLREGERIDVNPYKIGFVGSTDTHWGTPGNTEEAGKPTTFRSDPLEMLRIEGRRRARIFQNPGGLAGIWAEENTRDALFDAMKRREAFATSGVRIAPRFFAGWDLPEDLCQRPARERVALGYARGVPMGGELPIGAGEGGDAQERQAPVFAAWAHRDIGRADGGEGLLQRIQIVKGWVGDDGSFHQAVVDVAGDPDGGAGVHPQTCQPLGPGADELCAVWRDPGFDPGRSAVYYARILENPSCRWSTRRCLALPEAERPDGCSDPRVPKAVQERAWTSPIWIEPQE
jgi:hypothetical protein